MPFQTTTLQFSEEYKALTQRERDLNDLIAANETDTETLIEMLKVLGDDYEREGHDQAAGRCRKKMDRLTWK